jgi:hypothetical protein
MRDIGLQRPEHNRMPSFKQLNHGWNAEPNAPAPQIRLCGPDLLLRFILNAFQFQQFEEDEVGVLRFHDCLRYRLGPTNDEGWSRGQCRYSGTAPAWGKFYELTGEDPSLDEPTDWIMVREAAGAARHFLFYLRDDTFECISSDWSSDAHPSNALNRLCSRSNR